MRILVLFLLLFTSWWVFSGFFKPFFLIAGGLTAMLAVYIAVRMQRISQAKSLPLRFSFDTVKYLCWLAKEIVVAGLDVTKRIWQSEPDITPILAWVPITQADDAAKTLYANSITLTPGTVSIMVERKKMCVHALTEESIDDLLHMDSKVTQVVE